MTNARVLALFAALLLAFSPTVLATGGGECPNGYTTATVEECEEECPEENGTSTQSLKDEECPEVPFFPGATALVLGSLGAAAIAGFVIMRRRA